MYDEVVVFHHCRVSLLSLSERVGLRNGLDLLPIEKLYLGVVDLLLFLHQLISAHDFLEVLEVPIEVDFLLGSDSLLNFMFDGVDVLLGV